MNHFLPQHSAKPEESLHTPKIFWLFDYFCGKWDIWLHNSFKKKINYIWLLLLIVIINPNAIKETRGTFSVHIWDKIASVSSIKVVKVFVQ